MYVYIYIYKHTYSYIYMHIHHIMSINRNLQLRRCIYIHKYVCIRVDKQHTHMFLQPKAKVLASRKT